MNCSASGPSRTSSGETAGASTALDTTSAPASPALISTAHPIYKRLRHDLTSSILHWAQLENIARLSRIVSRL